MVTDIIRLSRGWGRERGGLVPRPACSPLDPRALAYPAAMSWRDVTGAWLLAIAALALLV